MTNFTLKESKRVKITYAGKQLHSCTFNKKNRFLERDEVREFAQNKSNELAKRYPNEQMSVLLLYDGIERPRSGGFTNVGNAVKMHDYGYEDDNDFEFNIIGFSLLYTFPGC